MFASCGDRALRRPLDLEFPASIEQTTRSYRVSRSKPPWFSFVTAAFRQYDAGFRAYSRAVNSYWPRTFRLAAWAASRLPYHIGIRGWRLRKLILPELPEAPAVRGIVASAELCRLLRHRRLVEWLGSILSRPTFPSCPGLVGPILGTGQDPPGRDPPADLSTAGGQDGLFIPLC